MLVRLETVSRLRRRDRDHNPAHSTHFRSFRRRWVDCGISQDCSRSQSPQCVRCWVVCTRPLLITVVCICIIWKALCPHVLDARLGLWVSLEHAFLFVTRHARLRCRDLQSRNITNY